MLKSIILNRRLRDILIDIVRLGKIPLLCINEMSVCSEKTQISLGIRPVWSESSLCAQMVKKDPSFLHADSEASDQFELMPKLFSVLSRHTATVDFHMSHIITSVLRI